MSVLERIRAIRDAVPADQVVARAALGEVLTVLEGEEEGLRLPVNDPEGARLIFGTRPEKQAARDRLVDGWPRDEHGHRHQPCNCPEVRCVIDGDPFPCAVVRAREATG